ncbi:hypothetical protein OF83DRAFT_1178679 [Amylostereum chailletii]|nr:hypothetical protein OF83DRAFT_1178679 [Amylostereum chailletii]
MSVYHHAPEPPTVLLDSTSSRTHSFTASPRPKPHSDLWFSDGSVVLQAENVLFKVHMTQLARKSIIFGDMFSIPQPPHSPSASGSAQAESETFEGCPLVRLHDDPTDLANLLTALYDGPSFGDNDEEDFRVVSGILRLSTKYMFDSLRSKAIAHLGLAWPSTLKGWDAREERARSYGMENTGPGGGHYYPSPIAIINLAQEVNAPSLLPSAFYDLSRYTYAQIFECSDGSHFPSRAASPTSPQPPTGLPQRAHPNCLASLTLRTKDLQRLALGKESAALEVPNVIAGMGRRPPAHGRKSSVALASQASGASPLSASSLASSPILPCASPSVCRRDFAELVALATQHYVCDRERGCADPLYVAEELGALKSAELSECGACARSLENWAVKERERIWKMIPGWFRVEA